MHINVNGKWDFEGNRVFLEMCLQKRTDFVVINLCTLIDLKLNELYCCCA